MFKIVEFNDDSMSFTQSPILQEIMFNGQVAEMQIYEDFLTFIDEGIYTHTSCYFIGKQLVMIIG